MSTGPSRAALIWRIVHKDLREFSRDRLWVVLTPFSLALFIVGFRLLPNSVDETVEVGVFPPDMALAMSAGSRAGDQGATGLEVVAFQDLDALVAAVSDTDGDHAELSIGLAFPPDFAQSVGSGRAARVTLYVDGSVPAEVRQALSSMVREIAYGVRARTAGKHPSDALPVTLAAERLIVLGEDRAGAQVPLRVKMWPMFAVIMLMIEALALAGLVAVEIQHRTVSAVLVTPVRTSDLLAAKGITGAVLGTSQILLFQLTTLGFTDQWLLITTLLVLGAVMVSAVGMLIGAAGKDFTATLMIGVVFIIPLMIPAFGVLFPGSASGWVKAMPSYGLVEALVGAVGYARDWGQLSFDIGITASWIAGLFGLAVLVLKRRVEAA